MTLSAAVHRLSIAADWHFCAAPAAALQNFFLYFYGMCFNLVGLSMFWLMGAITPSTMFVGFRQVRGRSL
jgi:hypothetical protein